MRSFILIILVVLSANIAFGSLFLSSKIVTNGDMSSSINSLPTDVSQMKNVSIQAVFTGAPVGSLKLQFSDGFVLAPDDDCSSVTIWTDYTGSSQAISAAGDFAYNLLDAGYRCLRFVYTRTSGSGILNVTFSGKGS